MREDHLDRVKDYLACIEKEQDNCMLFMGERVDERFTKRELITIINQLVAIAPVQRFYTSKN
jgi:hypothetical protein